MSGVDHWLVATIYNPCSEAYDVVLFDGYVIGGMTLVNNTTGEGIGMDSMSSGDVSVVEIEPGEWLDEAVWMGTLSDGEYDLSVVFSDEEETLVTTSFSVR